MSNQETTPYCRAAKFPNERAAGAAYFRMGDMQKTPTINQRLREDKEAA